jgi:hypothetical protein
MFTFMPVADGNLDQSVLVEIRDELREVAESEQPLDGSPPHLPTDGREA